MRTLNCNLRDYQRLADATGTVSLGLLNDIEKTVGSLVILRGIINPLIADGHKCLDNFRNDPEFKGSDGDPTLVESLLAAEVKFDRLQKIFEVKQHTAKNDFTLRADLKEEIVSEYEQSLECIQQIKIVLLDMRQLIVNKDIELTGSPCWRFCPTKENLDELVDNSIKLLEKAAKGDTGKFRSTSQQSGEVDRYIERLLPPDNNQSKARHSGSGLLFLSPSS